MAALVVMVLAGCGATGGKERSAPATNESSIPSSSDVAAGDREKGDENRPETIKPETTKPESTTTTTEAVKPADARASKYVKGNGSPAFGPGEPGKLSVVLVGAVPASPGLGVSVPVVVRNNTTKTLTSVEATGRATDGGKLVGSGSSQGFEPALVAPGEIAFGYVFFSSTVPQTSVVEVRATGEAPGGVANHIPLVMGETNLVPGEYSDSIVGEATAESKDVSGPIAVRVMCFDAAGKPTGTPQGFLSGDELPAGETGTYSVDLYGDLDCTTYLVGASGYDF